MAGLRDLAKRYLNRFFKWLYLTSVRRDVIRLRKGFDKVDFSDLPSDPVKKLAERSEICSSIIQMTYRLQSSKEYDPDEWQKLHELIEKLFLS